MSWIVGMFGGAIPESIQMDLHSRFRRAGTAVTADGRFLAYSGGNADTSISYSDDTITFLVAGVGILRSSSSSTILTPHDWRQRLTPAVPAIGDLDGHFAVVRYRNGILECFSDRVGLRTLYAARTHYGWVFSTQMETVCSLLPSSSIDWKTFGSRWLCVQQCSHESPVLGLRKLPPNGMFRFSSGEVFVASSPWLQYAPSTSTPQQAVEMLRSVLSIHGRTFQLGLSGGLDSRVLLALLSSSGHRYAAYAFGSADDPDVALAGRICRSEGIPFRSISEPLPPADRCIALMQEYVRRTHLADGAAASVRLRYYSALYEPNHIMIDGGNGEILRRQFLQRVLFFSRDDLMHRRTERLLPHFLLHRADIFTRDVTAQMNAGAADSLDRSLHSLPGPGEIGAENYLDAWIINTKIPIVACDEQARIDESTANFMPFSQPSVLQCALSLPVNVRHNNRLLKNIIRSHAPSLSQYPLVKNGIAYPYRLTVRQSRLWAALRSRIGRKNRDNDLRLFLDSVREFALDTVHSAGTRNYAAYRYEDVLRIVTGYYSGNRQYARELNWWLAFDVWRRAVEK